VASRLVARIRTHGGVCGVRDVERIVVELDEVGAQLGGSPKYNINILMRPARFESAKLPRPGHFPYPAQVERQRSLPRILTPLPIIGWTPVEELCTLCTRLCTCTLCTRTDRRQTPLTVLSRVSTSQARLGLLLLLLVPVYSPQLLAHGTGGGRMSFSHHPKTATGCFGSTLLLRLGVPSRLERADQVA
jgi:hypothetical protein